MDGIHDMGGMHGFGRVEPEEGEPVFHARWEQRVFALTSAAQFAVPFSDDHLRPAIERIPPERFLKLSYYAKWLEALIVLLQERSYLTDAEFETGEIESVSPERIAILLKAAEVVPAIWGGASQAAPIEGATPRFEPGDAVMTKRQGHAGHTRLPRYARGKPGRIFKVHGTFLVADLNSIGDTTPEMLYTVVFDARAIWGPEAGPRDTITLDLWDRYLEPL